MHVIVSGGSSGIGLEIARLYAGRGARLTLIARDMTRLENARRELLPLSGGEIGIYPADIGSATEISAAIAAAESHFGPCDILVACAGVVEPGAFEMLSADVFDAQIRTNLIGTANAMRAVYPGMKSRGRGCIMIVSSGAGLIGLHGYTAYCASKSALTGLAESLAMEAKAVGVDVLICYPPDTFTPQFERELLSRPAEAQALMGKARPWTAQAVAARIVRAIDRGTPRLYFGFSITALGLFGPLIKPVLGWWYGRSRSGSGSHRDR